MEDAKDSTVHLKLPRKGTSVPASELEERIKELMVERGKGNGFQKEFESLSKKCAFSRSVGQKDVNKDKNRHRSVLPYDNSRVILAKPWTHDYINANYIKPEDKIHDEVGKSTFIATQGCLSSTVADFWHMVWQENVSVIVMLTNEGNKKCSQYWSDPDPAKPKMWGRMQLIHRKSEEHKGFVIRKFYLCKDGKMHSVLQFHFQGWPDHGVPDDPSCVLDFISKVNFAHRSCAKPGPIIVHCSAGIGRTGTFIVINFILDQIKKCGLNTDIDVARTVQAARYQRPGMVQTEVQYEFIYMVLLSLYRDFIAKATERTGLGDVRGNTKNKLDEGKDLPVDKLSSLKLEN